ncbi:MAG: YkgJ family cysteine cluster protein [Proteobacteria bacterium]|nr:YkgJ family cysteine cluster protein [Pseudomonadota bacterium]
MEAYTASIGIDEPFAFSCSPVVTCFNECCRDLNQFLTPYDVLRLKNALKITSSDFLDQYTMLHTGPESGLPVVTLRPKPGKDMACPFVTSSGCAVYDDRPAACRAYPIARAIKRSRETGEISEYFMLIKEPHCKGHEQRKTQTVREWLKDQGLSIYNTMNDMLMEIISLKNRMMPGQLDRHARQLFYLACYDMDTFRTDIFKNNLLSGSMPENTLLELIGNNETALLTFGHAWTKQKLFGIHIDYDQLCKVMEET